MAKVTYADTIRPSFGIQFPKELFKYTAGQLECVLSEEELMAKPPEELSSIVALLEEQPAAAIKDPLEWGWILESWERCNQLWPEAKSQVIFGGNRSSKTSYAGALILDVMRKIPEAMTYSLQTNEERSIKINQTYVWDWLPERLKKYGKKKGENFNLNWTQKNGFAGDVCIIPPELPGAQKGSSCFFKNYSQYHNNQQAFEGLKGHLIHWDEEIPHKLFETLFARLGDYHGKMLGTVTTLQGYTPLIMDLLKGAETLEVRYAPLVGKELPILQKCKTWPDTYIHYWWTQDNLFIDAEEIVRAYVNRPVADKMARIYGIPARSQHNKFPKFSREVNVVKHEEIPFIEDPNEKVTRYFVTDPGGSKPWVAIWAGIVESGDIYIYREFPDFGNYGEWAIPHQTPSGQSLGKAGSAQKPMGFGFREWKNMFEGLEHGEEILIRWVDPSFSRQKITKESGQSDILEEMAAVDFHLVPAPWGDVESGQAKLNDILSWDDTKPFSETNSPKLYISECCENTIQSMLEYTGVSKMEHWKDFVDTVRYLVTSGSNYVEGKGAEAYGGGGY